MKGPTAVVLESLAMGKHPKKTGGLLTKSVAMKGQPTGLEAGNRAWKPSVLTLEQLYASSKSSD